MQGILFVDVLILCTDRMYGNGGDVEGNCRLGAQHICAGGASGVAEQTLWSRNERNILLARLMCFIHADWFLFVLCSVVQPLPFKMSKNHRRQRII